jgi:hypothetical protein
VSNVTITNVGLLLTLSRRMVSSSLMLSFSGMIDFRLFRSFENALPSQAIQLRRSATASMPFDASTLAMYSFLYLLASSRVDLFSDFISPSFRIP